MKWKHKKDDIAKTRNWVKDIITTGKDSNKKVLPKTQEMIFYQLQIKECWFHINGTCKFEKNCINEHKIRCLEQVLTGKCQYKNCKRAHPLHSEPGEGKYYFRPFLVFQ